MSEENEYDQQAKAFLEKYGIKLSIKRGDYKEPLWEGPHGDHYRITVTKKSGKRISFSFWDSIANMQEGKQPRPYDALACMSADSNYADMTADEIIQELDGTIAQAQATVKFAQKLRNFFTEQELTNLQKIN